MTRYGIPFLHRSCSRLVHCIDELAGLPTCLCRWLPDHLGVHMLYLLLLRLEVEALFRGNHAHEKPCEPQGLNIMSSDESST